MDVLEYVIRMRGAAAASAEVRGLARDFDKLAASETAAAGAGKRSSESQTKGAAAMALVTKASRVGALALAATAFEAVHLSNTFDTEMLKVQTQAGASTSELQYMRGAVLDLAKSGAALGQSPESLAMGLYHLESLNIRGARALHALTLASEAATISGADLEETTSALGAAMFVGIKGAGSLDHIMALLNATVGQGNMRMGELVHSLGTGVLSSAKVAGLGINDVMSALALFADAGQNASGAAAQFATALHFLYNPTTKARGALAAMHLGADQLAIDLRKPNGMITALTDLRDHLSGFSKIRQEQLLGQILPGGRGRILLTELTMLDRAQQKWGAINKQATAANFRAAVEAQKHNPATMLRIAWQKLRADLIDFGHKVGPVLVPVLVTVTGALAGLLHLFAKFPAIPMILFVALLTVGFMALAGAVYDALAAMVAFVISNPILLAITAIIVLIALVATHFDQFKRGVHIWAMAIVGAWHAVTHGLGEAASWIASKFMSIVHFVASIPGKIANVAHGMWDGIKNAFRSAINWIIRAWDSLHFHVPGVHIPLIGHVGGFDLGVPKIPLLAQGGIARAAGAAVVGDNGPELLDLPAGARVTPLSGGGVPWLGRDIVVKVDGRELGRATRRQILETQAQG